MNHIINRKESYHKFVPREVKFLSKFLGHTREQKIFAPQIFEATFQRRPGTTKGFLNFSLLKMESQTSTTSGLIKQKISLKADWYLCILILNS